MNLFYLMARATDEVLITNCTNENGNAHVISHSEETDDEII